VPLHTFEHNVITCIRDHHHCLYLAGTKMLRVEALDTMLKNTNKYIRDVVGTKVKNILYFIRIKDHWKTL